MAITFQNTCCGIPCLIKVISWDYYVNANTENAPQHWHPAEGGIGNWEVLDRKGKKAFWLEKKLQNNKKEFDRLNKKVFEFMED